MPGFMPWPNVFLSKPTKSKTRGPSFLPSTVCSPSDIVVKAVTLVPDSFDARHSSYGKIYCYKFSYGERDPLQKETRAQLERRNFDPSAFKTALGYFKGTHNFQNFTTKPDDVDGFIRNIEAIDIVLDEKSEDRRSHLQRQWLYDLHGSTHHGLCL
jgi:tRNA pseudouridine(38-40) synthase